jgi:hypothetical protein
MAEKEEKPGTVTSTVAVSLRIFWKLSVARDFLVGGY